MTENYMHDWRRECRCAGVIQSEVDSGWLGAWCEHLADQEDGLCEGCRNGCATGGHHAATTLTMEQAWERAVRDGRVSEDQAV